MGLYLNPGNDSFRIAVNGAIYVDKTGMISFLNRHLDTEARYVCVSRPRRFGKSMAAGMLAAYYSRGCASKKLFEGYKVAEDALFLNHLNRHDVIYLNIQQFLRKTDSYADLSACIEQTVLKELKDVYPDCCDFSQNLPDALSFIYSQSSDEKKGFIFILDEWDCIFRVAKNDAAAQEKYLDFLRDLFKDRSYVSLAYMTGILPIKKYGTHSAINIFDEYSMMNPQELAAYVGFTEEEVKALCAQYEMDFESVRSWYDGYRFKNSRNIYNPKSVVDAMRKKELDSYWTQTETYEALKIYIELDFDGLKTAIITMLGGEHYKINPRRFQNDMTSFRTKDDVLTLLVHLGYLAYDRNKQEVYIPNQEIVAEFMNALDAPEWSGVTEVIGQSKRLLVETLAMNAEAVAAGMNKIHGETASILKYNDENALACAVLIAYYSAKSYYLPPVRELPTGKRFADIVYFPHRDERKPALLIELKWDKPAESAISQIKERNYAERLKHYTGDILLVGISYDKKEKIHSCVIEKYCALGAEKAAE